MSKPTLERRGSLVHLQRDFHSHSVNENVIEMKYAVRGALVLHAGELKAQLAAGGDHGLPFDEVIFCNIGNPQQLEQPPITFLRQVLAGVMYPPLCNADDGSSVLAADARARARAMNAAVGPSSGAYSHSKGHAFVRQHVAEFIEQRDGYPSDPEHIFLTDGASPAVKTALTMLIRSRKDGIMIPIPQYPLYSATIELLNGTAVNYYLDEEKSWSLSIDELERSYAEATKNGIDVRALAIINPGNPTGQVMSYENIAAVVKWADEKDVVLLADEVYQTNVYHPERKFTAFKQVVRDLKSSVLLVSFHSVSKGVLGECGKRGGYMEVCNFDKELVDIVYKFASVSLCPNVIGQLTVDLMVKPPAEGDESHAKYTSEVKEIFESLGRRAQRLADMLNSLEGVTCNQPEGALYVFPQIRLPKNAIKEAEKNHQSPDTYYCFRLLDETGICVIPGSGFGQRDGTFHFRTTFLPREDKVDKVAEKLSNFHKKFMAAHAD